MIDHVYLIPLVPLVVSIVVLLAGKDGPKSLLPFLSTAAMGFCFFSAATVLYGVLGHQTVLPYIRRWDWFTVGGYPIQLGVFIDGSAALMLFMVTLVSFLVHLYSIGYMHGHERFKRFFAYIGFFTAAMLGLIVSSNLLTVFASWELMGVCSYLLIGFYFEKPSAAYASKKAFITTKLGDLGFYLGLLLLFKQTMSFDLPLIGQQMQANPGYIPADAATWIALLLFAGAVGKSAQVPLFIWLPDAMEGPSPVSALIHAATMVAAGIFLVARCYFVFAVSPLASGVVAFTGLATAFLAATMALVPYDLKRVLAFSTVSQLGFMMMALGVGPAGYTAGLFHLLTHAFFKACLFLGAGSVIHAMHTNDMRQMGGLSKQMLSTCITMVIATLAITGFPGLSGFFSKEAILAAVWEHSPAMWAVAVVTAGMTTFYMFRMIFMTFAGSARDHERWMHVHESPATMTIPLWVLALFSIGAGFFLSQNNLIGSLIRFEGGAPAHEAAGRAAQALLEGSHGAGEAHHPAFLLWAALAAFAAGVSAAFTLYGKGEFSRATELKSKLMPLFTLLENRYYLDAFFLKLVDASDALARVCWWIDDNIVDSVFVNAWAQITRVFAEAGNFFDVIFVDGAVDFAGTLTTWAGGGLRGLVRGQVQEYLLYVALAMTAFAMMVFGHG